MQKYTCRIVHTNMHLQHTKYNQHPLILYTLYTYNIQCTVYFLDVDLAQFEPICFARLLRNRQAPISNSANTTPALQILYFRQQQ
jgi:hypothetical protein